MWSDEKTINSILILLLLIAGIFLFANLGNVYLWQDEATTAVLASNTLTFGVPRAYDGENLVRNIYEDPCKYKGWKYGAWLQFYVTALFFWLFGKSTFIARLPFALFSLGNVVLCYILSNRIFKNKSISIITVTLMIFSMPFLLYARQCRWYALVMFFTLSLLLSYLNLLDNNKNKFLSGLGFTGSAICLFHSNFGIFPPVIGAVGLHYLVFNRKKLSLKTIVSIISITAVFTVPFVLYCNSWEYGGDFSLERAGDHLEFYIRVLNKYIMPLVFVFISLIFFYMSKSFPILKYPLDRSLLWLMIMVMISTICFLLLADERQLRYIIHLSPICFMLLALILTGWWKKSKIAAIIFFVLLAFTNVFHTGAPFAKKVKLHIYDYIWEITHDYDGPTEGIVEFLKDKAKPTDVVKVNYGSPALMFYTDLKIDNDTFMNQTYPEWIIHRNDWAPEEFRGSEYQKKIESLYNKIVLPIADIRFENRPDPGYHKFRTVTDWPNNVVIYRKK